MKRFDPFWRIVIALLLIFALAPVVALSGAVIAAPDPAETTITPISDYVNSLTSITGTATGNTSNVTAVEVLIQRYSDGRYWTGTTWVISPVTWLDATALIPPFNTSSIEPWTITTATSPRLPIAADLDDGVTYRIEARAYDAGGPDTTPDIESFTYDITEPDTTIDDIPTYVNDLPEITGTALDTDGELAGVEVRIQRDSDDKYWSGTTWQTSSKWIDAIASVGTFDSDDEDWKITTTTSPRLPKAADLNDSVTYTIEARAEDVATNVDATPDTESFTYDITEPDTTIDDIPAYVNELTEITGAALDTDGELAGVELLIQRDSDDEYWTGIKWQNSSTWIDATASVGTFDSAVEDWKVTINTSPRLPQAADLDNGVTYSIEARAEDVATNVDATPDTESFTYDITEPDTDIDDIPASVGELTEITGTASDTSPGKVAGVEVLIQRYSDDKYWNGTNWVVSETWLDAIASVGTFDSASEAWEITTNTSPALPTTWGGGEKYNIKARAIDAAENVDPSPATVDVTIGSSGLLWWHYLLIALGSIILIGVIFLLRQFLRGPKGGPPEGLQPEEFEF